MNLLFSNTKLQTVSLNGYSGTISQYIYRLLLSNDDDKLDFGLVGERYMLQICRVTR